ncbi:hypothetical protein N7448_000466 [Penicillium atrosanguineum]|nr:hypothetical protein N7448_000466 [Penicillium atrosanguineum]
MPDNRAPAGRQLLISRALFSGGESSQMLNKDQRRNDVRAQARQEEARLLGARDYKYVVGNGDGGAIEVLLTTGFVNCRDKNAVPITPGASLQKNRRVPGSTAAFRPTDRISHRARDSGPVRASGKQKGPKSSSKKNPPRLDDAPEFEESNRPSKRRRQDDHSKVLEWADGANVPMPRASSSSSQNSAKPTNNGFAKQHDEFRGVEDSIKINRSPQILRRSQHTRFASDEGAQADKRPELPKQSLFEIIENHDSAAKDPSHQIATHAISNTRESPDELQGEATTRGIPSFLDDKQNQSLRKLNTDKPMSPVRKRSPSDIRTTYFASSPSQGPKKIKRTHNTSIPCINLSVNYLRYGSTVKIVEVHKPRFVKMMPEKIELGEDIAEPGKKVEILMRNVRLAYRGMDKSLKMRLKLSQKSESPGDSFVDIDFSMPIDKLQFVERLEDSQIKIQDKPGLYMDKAFENYAKEMDEHGKHPKQPFLDSSVSEAAPMAPAASKMRQKISSALQKTKDETNESKRVKTKASARTLSSQADGSGDLGEGTSNLPNDSDSGVQIPVKPFRPREYDERETRATRRTTRIPGGVNGPDISTDTKIPPYIYLKDDAARKKWKKPLVYPWTGKKKAEVCVEDRDRLREDEFLNDNLIGFYMRFLQDHLERTNQKAAEKVYFFNSYFFDTLTNTPKGEHGINYSGVEKWTRSVDLFSYDYIVVPINQAAHWYVAIICNLPSLEVGTADPVPPSSASVSEKETSNQPESDVHEILESPEPEPVPVPTTPEEKTRNSESPRSEDVRQPFASMTIQEQEKAQKEAEKLEVPTETDEWPEGEENQTSPPAKLSPFKETSTGPQTTLHTASHAARKTKKGKAGPKLSPSQTTIVTFDSLDLGRSPTIKMLRDYICKEASSKRGVQIEPTDIKGMRARQIPLQPNFSDCGLYLLAYIEKFVQDPDSFITKLLKREMDQVDDWPPLGSGLLRHRLRTFLDDLYDEQARIKNLSSGRVIMADQQPVSYLLGPPLPSQADPDEKGNAEPPQLTDPAEDKGLDKKPAVENTVRERDEPTGSSAADQPDLEPAVSTSTPDFSKGTKAPGPPPADADTTSRPALPEGEEVVEVPDSQETGQAPGPKSNRTEKKKAAKAEEPPPLTGSQSGRRPLYPSTQMWYMSSSDLRRNPPKDSQVQVQIQVRRTPPPSSPEHVRKSPRGKPRKN